MEAHRTLLHGHLTVFSSSCALPSPALPCPLLHRYYKTRLQHHQYMRLRDAARQAAAKRQEARRAARREREAEQLHRAVVALGTPKRNFVVHYLYQTPEEVLLRAYDPLDNSHLETRLTVQQVQHGAAVPLLPRTACLGAVRMTHACGVCQIVRILDVDFEGPQQLRYVLNKTKLAHVDRRVRPACGQAAALWKSDTPHSLRDGWSAPSWSYASGLVRANRGSLYSSRASKASAHSLPLES